MTHDEPENTNPHPKKAAAHESPAMAPEAADNAREAAAEEASEPTEPTPEERIEALEAELAEQKHEVLLQAAEVENFKKRTQRDKVDAIRRANESLLADILPVVDNLERALVHAPEGDPLADGLKMVLRLFSDTLARHGVEEVNAAVGDAFDPQIHDAIASQPAEDADPNTVLRQDMKGYRLSGKLIRPAQVIVAASPATSQN